MENTKLWIVVNEETLNTMKGKHGKTAKFKTEKEANEKASTKLELWVCVEINFTHKRINLTNQKIKMKNLIKTLLGIAGLYGCLYLLLGTLTLVELFLGLR